MAIELRKTGIHVVGDMPWGTHFCYFYETKEDLLDILIPYFQVGLENDEFCLWVISSSELLTVEEATTALRKALPDLDRYLAKRSIELVAHDDWFLIEGVFDFHRVANRFKEKLDEVLARGYAGMRVNGSPAWLYKKDGKELREFEEQVDKLFPNLRIIAACTYPLAACGAAQLFDVARTHQFAIVRRHGNWEVVETPELKQAKAEIKKLNEELEQRVVERTRELAAANEDLKTEITERKRAEDALRRSEDQLRLLIDTIPAMVFTALPDGSVDFVNQRWLQYMGLSLEDVRGWRWDVAIHPEDRARSIDHWRSTMAVGKSAENELRVQRADGAYHWILGRFVPLRDELGRIVKWYGVSTDIDDRKRAEEELRTSREQLRALAAYLQSVREEERSRIARELHDEIGQALTGIKLVLERTIREQAASVRANLTQALGVANELIGRVRDLSLELRPPMLDDLGLLAALRWHFERYTSQVNIKVDFNHTGLQGHRFAPEIETAAYRIVQEALTNVARHAGVDRAEVGVTVDKSALRIRIQDGGGGFDPDSLSARTTGGLYGMRERAILLGGQLKVDSALGTGTLLIAELPTQVPSPSKQDSKITR